MFAVAFLIGIYSYIIFAIGVSGNLYKSSVLISSIVFLICSVLYFKKHNEEIPKINFKNKKIRPLILLFAVMAFVNLIGALGPELSFDALWYHLTIPKIFIQEQRILYIDGGLLYYSLMPKLSEMLFIPGLVFGSEIPAKLIQWGFGILTSFVVYKISRKFFDEKISILSSLVFYGSLVVGWQSTAAYVDLVRCFFEIMALWGFLEYYKTKKRILLIESAVLVGLAASVKLIALGSLPIFLILLFITEKNKIRALKNMSVFLIFSILVPLPWFIFSFINSGNPIYPIFSGYPIDSSVSLFHPFNIAKDYFHLFLKSADPISPIFVIFLPLLIIYFKKFDSKIKLIAIYSLIALVIWYITPRTGGGRFILPYLPAFSILAGAVIANTKLPWLKKYLTFIVVIVLFISMGYRGIANARYVPVILGIQSKEEFLTKNLNFNFGDFYDTDGWFKENIKENDKVLLYGFHNLYYVDFPFVHESYVKKGDRFNYIATQKTDLPERFLYWTLIYNNNLTGVRVYTFNKDIWYY